MGYPVGMDEREQGRQLQPRWNANGLVTGVVTDAGTGELLMVAHLNEEALRLTLATGEAHFWSRSRGQLWKKGETSGNVLRIGEVRVDCDQDALWLRVEPAGPACHTGERSCFYRRVNPDGSLERDTAALLP
ncbi:phosphoribosyl-AMP cyclohydrolase [Sphingomonas sp.]|jgi:phosphoribosyl-AMP cyclohydrolase|uniref:phosphoribosyl-AMP cyclohydrolase n=1 Tax=Sphingomonas sp. TaxID=28214 RepID=UPI0039C9226C